MDCSILRFNFSFLPSWYQLQFLPLPWFFGQRQKIRVLSFPLMNPCPLHFSLHSWRPVFPTLQVGMMLWSLKAKFGSQPMHLENRWKNMSFQWIPSINQSIWKLWGFLKFLMFTNLSPIIKTSCFILFTSNSFPSTRASSLFFGFKSLKCKNNKFELIYGS